MSDFIVLVKQVPDVSKITDNAFDPETGNLIRARLPSVINELDAHALAFAARMADISTVPGDGSRRGRIICLTMGPPPAAEVLRYCLGRRADTAVLLTDKALGGADTWATANPLAAAIRRIVKDMLGGTSDYYIVAGMQSVDGDTAQVPAQIAQELGTPCVSYATDAAWKEGGGGFEFTRIISGGSQVVALKGAPAVITVAKYEYPLFATFSAARRADRFELIQWGLADIDAKAFGAGGSKTSVIRVFPPEKTARRCRQVTDIAALAGVIAQSIKDSGNVLSGGAGEKRRYVLPAQRKDCFDRSFEGLGKDAEDYAILGERFRQLGISRLEDIDGQVRQQIISGSAGRFNARVLEEMLGGYGAARPSYQGDVWVIAEHGGGKIHPATLELTGKARELADSLKVGVGAVVAGNNAGCFAGELIAGGADKVYVAGHRLLAEFDPRSYCRVVADICSRYRPQVVLYAATPQGRVLAPMVAYRLGCGLTADCTGLEIRDSSRRGLIAGLFQTRPALGGNVMATIVTKDSNCQMATARPGVMKPLARDTARRGSVIEHQVDIGADDVSLVIVETRMGSGRVDFGADAIISGGRGMQDADTYERLTGLLCLAISDRFGIKAEKGASRAAIEQGFVDRIHQVGQTGTAVAPKLYVALGISGAIQHMIGVANAQTIIAINNDPHAPIFRQCDYYYTGTVQDVVAGLIEELKSR